MPTFFYKFQFAPRIKMHLNKKTVGFGNIEASEKFAD